MKFRNFYDKHNVKIEVIRSVLGIALMWVLFVGFNIR